MRNSILLASVVTVTAVACSSSNKKPAPADPSGANATANVESVAQLVSDMHAGNAEAAAADVVELGAFGEESEAQGSAAPRSALPPMTWPGATQAADQTGTASCSATSCTYSNYGDTYDGVSYSLNGTISYDGTTLTVDLTYQLTSASGDISETLQGTVTWTSTLIDGSIAYDLMFTDASSSATFSGSVMYDHIGLQDGMCPISGALESTWNVSDSAGSYSWDLEAEFGPSCGDVTVTYSGGA